MTAKEYRQANLDERRRHNRVIESRNAERDIKRDNERREQERQYRNHRIFSNVISAPQATSSVLRSVLGYFMIIALIVNLVRVSSDMPPLTITGFFEIMSVCPEVDFTRAHLNIPAFSWGNVTGALLNSFVVPYLRMTASIWNFLVFLCESLLNCVGFMWYLISYFFGWFVPV